MYWRSCGTDGVHWWATRDCLYRMVRPPPPLSDPDLSLFQVEYPSYGGRSDGWSALEKVSDNARTLKREFYFQNLWIITYIKSPVL